MSQPPPKLPEGREMRIAGNKPVVEYRAADGGQEPAAFVGTAIVCGVRSVSLGFPGFRFVETINPTALDGADLSEVEGVFNHNSDVLLGHTRSGTLELTRNASGGLDYRIAYDPADPDHVRVMRKIERGDVVGSSFVFTIKSGGDVWAEEQDAAGGSLYTREVTAIDKVYDVCPVTSPAYTDSKAAKRSLDHFQEEQGEGEERMGGMKMGKKKKAKRDETDAEKAERAFLEEMIPHHEMAVEMATSALDKVENPDVRSFCQSIIDGQGAEIDKMKQWLTALDSTRSSTPLEVYERILSLS